MDPVQGELALVAAALRRSVRLLRRAITRSREVDDDGVDGWSSTASAASIEADTGSRVTTNEAITSYLSAPLDAIDARLDDLLARPANPRLHEIVMDELASHYRYLGTLHSAAAWLPGAIPQVSLGVTYFVEQAFRAITGATNRVRFNPLASYEFYRDSLSEIVARGPLRTRLKIELPTNVPDPQILGFPLLEAATSMLSPIFVHEIGHAAVSQQSALHFSPDSEAINDGVESAGLAALERPQALTRLEKRCQRWHRELIADAVAAGYLGPSYVLAAATYLIPQGARLYDEDHPPPSQRIEYMLNALDQTGWLPHLETAMPALLNTLTAVAKLTTRVIGQDGVDEFGLRYFADRAPEVWSQASAYLGDRVFRYQDYDNEQYFAELLLQELPLVQTQSKAPALHREIMVATWLHEARGDSADALFGAIDDARVQDYLSKGLEMSSLLRGWRDFDATARETVERPN